MQTLTAAASQTTGSGCGLGPADLKHVAVNNPRVNEKVWNRTAATLLAVLFGRLREKPSLFNYVPLNASKHGKKADKLEAKGHATIL